MADPTVVGFRATYPEFTEDKAPDIVVEAKLDYVGEKLSRNAWGDCYVEAVYTYIAHELALSAQRVVDAESSASGLPGAPNAGEITSSSAGGLSVSFSGKTPESSGEAWFNTTPYGKIYLKLIEECIHVSDVAGSAYSFYRQSTIFPYI